MYKTFFFDNTSEFNKIINRVVKIGEYLSKVSDETKNKYSHINWNIIKDKALDEEKVGHEMNVNTTYEEITYAGITLAAASIWDTYYAYVQDAVDALTSNSRDTTIKLEKSLAEEKNEEAKKKTRRQKDEREAKSNQRRTTGNK